MRAALYARYSDDSQRPASIEDQVRICRERIDREGWSLVQTYVDRAISGASLIRPGVQALIADAMTAEFDVVVVEALDRLSRDQEDIAGLYKRMSFAGVRMFALDDGEITDLHVGLKGTMNARFLKDLANKTRRGLRGRVEAGKSGGGNSFGYSVVRRLGADGSPVTGERTINQHEAQVVRDIFRQYASGVSPRKIAAALNARGVPAPGGCDWSSSTINGNAERGTGILNNELYIGRLIWNRLRYVKHPDTGKRISKLNPQTEWVIKDVPELRIVDDHLWSDAKQRQKEQQKATRPDALGQRPFWGLTRPKTLLSGLLTCGQCGGSYVKISADHMGCAAARNKGTCNNLRTIRRDRLEDRVLAGLRDNLLEPDLYDVFVTEFYAELNRLRTERQGTLAASRRELANVERKMSQLVAAIADGGPARPLGAELAKLEARQIVLEAELRDAEQPEQPLLHPNLPKLYRQRVAALVDGMNDPELRAKAFDGIRALIDEVVLTPADGTLAIELRGELAAILTLCANAKRNHAPPDKSDEALQIKVVAGTGFEPVTFRL